MMAWSRLAVTAVVLLTSFGSSWSESDPRGPLTIGPPTTAPRPDQWWVLFVCIRKKSNSFLT